MESVEAATAVSYRPVLSVWACGIPRSISGRLTFHSLNSPLIWNPVNTGMEPLIENHIIVLNLKTLIKHLGGIPSDP